MKHNALLQLQVDNWGLEEGERGEKGKGAWVGREWGRINGEKRRGEVVSDGAGIRGILVTSLPLASALESPTLTFAPCLPTLSLPGFYPLPFSLPVLLLNPMVAGLLRWTGGETWTHHSVGPLKNPSRSQLEHSTSQICCVLDQTRSTAAEPHL